MTVTINPFDQDAIIVNGAVATFETDISARFNGYTDTFPSQADLDERKYVRYFPKSGTYRVKHIGIYLTTSAKVDIGINKLGETKNTTNIFNQLDTYNAGNLYNQISHSIISVPRGYNEINVKTNGKNASSTDYRNLQQLIEFELIDEHPVNGEDGIAQINQSSHVLLAKYKCEIAESTKTFNFADILDSKFSEIIVKINGEMTASAQLQMTINGNGANYLQLGNRSVGGTNTAINITTGAVLAIASVTILSGATTFYTETKIQKDEAGIWSGGWSEAQGFSVGSEYSGWNNSVASTTKLTALVISTSTSTWKVGTTIEIYGVRK